jgi:hypothetical protein
MGAPFSQLPVGHADNKMARIRFGSRLAALTIGIGVVVALWSYKPEGSLRDPPVISSIRLTPLEMEKPAVVAQAKQAPLEPSAPLPKAPALNEQPIPPTMNLPLAERAMKPRAQQSQALSPNPAVAPPTNAPVPRIAIAPGQTGQNAPSVESVGAPSTSSGNAQSGPSPRLGNNALAIVRARECARLDPRDRPSDCPPNAELARLLASERGPKYRPENADGFSRNETAWRGVPPPCLDDGVNAALKGSKLCVRVGTPPSRVRSPREICLARGLGGCEPPPSQAAVDAALKQVKASESARPN